MKVSLCPECFACPSVEVKENEVFIGENENLFKLTIEQWNVLKDKIKEGEL